MIDNHTYQHSYEVQEIIGKSPSWMVRFGIGSLFGAVCLLVALSLLTRYPQKAHYAANIVSDVPPQYLVKGPDETMTLIHSGGLVACKDTVAAVTRAGGGRYAILSDYTGTLVSIRPLTHELHETDTLALIIPRQAGYTFAGSLPAGLLAPVTRPLPVVLQVDGNDMAGNMLTLHGKLIAISPAINGRCMYKGILDLSADRQLANDNAFTSSCKGLLEIKLSEESLFAYFFHKLLGF